MLANPPRVLVAEDNLALAGVVRFNLEHAGFQVTVARDGQEAWDAMQDVSFDVLVTDQQMPRLTGEQLCTRIRADARFDRLPMIMVTAKGFELELQDLRDRLGVKEVIAKPFSPRDLVRTVQDCLAACARGFAE